MVISAFSNNISYSNIPTLVFIDYESWRYGLYNKYGMDTDIAGWFQDVKSKGSIEEIYVFGDFTNEIMAKDIPKLRTITNNIIDCRNPENQKDYTDFIILDHIYQKLIKSQHTKQYIIFSGDGHFHSVTAFLKNFNDKIVGVYAVNGTLSDQLKNSASWYIEVSPPIDDNSKYRKMILKNLQWAEMQPKLIPYFSQTINTTSKRFNADKDKLTAVLKNMIDDGYIKQVDEQTSDGKSIRALRADWTLLEKHRLWTPDDM